GRERRRNCAPGATFIQQSFRPAKERYDSTDPHRHGYRTELDRHDGSVFAMRDQYAGDISDVLKFAFLRALTGADRKLGIAWYYVPGHDGGRTDSTSNGTTSPRGGYSMNSFTPG